jgi:hypothetical protein
MIADHGELTSFADAASMRENDTPQRQQHKQQHGSPYMMEENYGVLPSSSGPSEYGYMLEGDGDYAYGNLELSKGSSFVWFGVFEREREKIAKKKCDFVLCLALTRIE